MLLQSHGGVIRPLPALPAAWSKGAAGGLRARGGFVVDVEWAAGRARQVRIASERGGACAVACAEDPASIVSDGAAVEFDRPDAQTIRFITDKGGTYRLRW